MAVSPPPPYVPAYCREQQLHFCAQLGTELRRQYRYDEARYARSIETLREFYRELRDGTQHEGPWRMLRVEEGLGQRGLGPRPFSQALNCQCVPFPGAWEPKVRTTSSEWHDVHVRLCLTCGEKRRVGVPRVFWPSSRALKLEEQHVRRTRPAEFERWWWQTTEGVSPTLPRKDRVSTLHR